MESETDCKGAATNSGPALSRADKMRFSTLTYEIIEELKMRRELAVENEKKIKKLINERFSMGWKLDQECGKVANLGERHEAELRETRRQLEEKMRDYQVEASQQQVYRKMAEKEKDALKDEIRRLQLLNYSLEKKVRESERQEKIHANEREQHIRQVSRFESQLGQLDTVMKQLTSKQDQLDADMKHVQHLNKSLQYQNSHQKCVLDMKEADLAKVSQELLDIKVKVKVEPGQLQDKEEELQNEVKRLQKHVDQLEEDYNSLDKDKDSWKEKYWDSLKKLEDSHRLINVHLHNAATYRDECNAIEELQKATKNKLNDTEQTLQQSREEMVNVRERHRTGVVEFETKITKLNEDIAKLITDVEAVTEQKETTEQSLQEANNSIAYLEKELTCMKAILNVEKISVEAQTELQMLQMLESEVQATPSIQHKEIQIQVHVNTGVTQTIDPALCSTEVQTNSIERSDKEIQTEYGQENTKCVEDAVTQTDEAIMKYGTFVNHEDREKNAGMEDTTVYVVAVTGKVHADNSTELKELYQESDTKEDAKKQCKDRQEKRSVNYISSEISGDTDKSANEMEMDQSLTRFDHIASHQAFEQPKETANDESKLMINAEKESVTKSSVVKLPKEKVQQMIVSSNRCQNLEKFKFDKSDRKEYVVMNKEGNTHDDILRENLKTCIADNLRPYEIEGHVRNEKIGQRGLSIPKIDLAKSMLNADVIAVDPDEFSIELTQEEKTGIESKYNDKENPTERKGHSSFISGYTREDKEVSSCHRIETASIEKSIEQNWEVSEMPSKIAKPKAKKHKLTKEVVSDQFSNFDISKEKFKQFLNKDEVQPKLPKLSGISKLMPKIRRNYSSMFKTDEKLEKVDESDTEEGNKEENVKEQEKPAFSDNSSCILSRSQKDQEFNKCATNKFSSKQTKIFAKDQTEERTIADGYSKDKVYKIISSIDVIENNYMIYEHYAENNNNIPLRTSTGSLLSKPFDAIPDNLDAKCETDSPNTLTQSDISSQELKELDNQIQEYPNRNYGGQSSPYSVSRAVFTAHPVKGIDTSGDSNPVTGFSASAPAPEGSATNVFKHVTPVSAEGTSNLSKSSLNANTQTISPPDVTNDVKEVSLQVSSPLVSRQTFITETHKVGKSKSSSLSSRAEGSTDFLQKYRDIVAKIKPVQNVSCIQNKESQKNSRQTGVTSERITLQDFGQKASARERTPRSILKGTSKGGGKPRNVTWNEYVLNKDFTKDGNSQDENK